MSDLACSLSHEMSSKVHLTDRHISYGSHLYGPGPKRRRQVHTFWSAPGSMTDPRSKELGLR
jgi:hypothetical protein